MASCACARFPLLAAVAALPIARAMRDTFDARSALDVSQDEADATMLDPKCCCADHPFGASHGPDLDSCVVVRTGDLEYIMPEELRGEGKWACPNGLREELHRRPPNCFGVQSARKAWTRPGDYKPSGEALKIGDAVIAAVPWAGLNANYDDYEVEEGAEGKVVKGNEQGAFTIEFGSPVGKVTCDEGKLSNLFRKRPDPVEPEVPRREPVSLDVVRNRLITAMNLDVVEGDPQNLAHRKQQLGAALRAAFASLGAGTDDPTVLAAESQYKAMGGEDLRQSKAQAVRSSGTMETDGAAATSIIQPKSPEEAKKGLQDAMKFEVPEGNRGLKEHKKQMLGTAILTAWASLPGGKSTKDEDVKAAVRAFNKIHGIEHGAPIVKLRDQFDRLQVGQQ